VGGGKKLDKGWRRSGEWCVVFLGGGGGGGGCIILIIYNATLCDCTLEDTQILMASQPEQLGPPFVLPLWPHSVDDMPCWEVVS